MLLFLWALAFLSPIIAIVLAGSFYAMHRRRHEPAQRFPLVPYVLILLVCAVVAFWLGMVRGSAWACSIPSSGNLCGLFGVFISGPLTASLAVTVLGWALLGFPTSMRRVSEAPTAPVHRGPVKPGQDNL
jgi:hypothetical protein